MIRQIEADAKISESVRLEALEQAIPYAEVQAVVAAHGLQRQRQRKLSAELGLLLGIAMHLFRGCSLTQVLWKLMKGVRLLHPETVPATQRGHQPAALCPGGRGHGGFVSPHLSAHGHARDPGRLLEGLAPDGAGRHG